jgi:YVTN family beta-propeller protein
VTKGSPLAGESSRRRLRVMVVAASVVAAIAGSAVLATRDSGEDVTTRGVTATLRVPGHPGPLTAGVDALWFALADAGPPARDRPLLRLDLASSAVQRTVSVGGQPSQLIHLGSRLLASVEHVGSDGSGPSLVVALDWLSGRVLARRQFPGSVGPLAAGVDEVWALQTRPAALLRLDPQTLTPTAAPLRLSAGRGVGLAVDGGYVWVATADPSELLRIEPAGRGVTRVRVGGSPVGIVVAGGGVWLADGRQGTVVRIDPRTLRQVGKSIRLSSEPSWLSAAGGNVFVGSVGGGTVTRIALDEGKQDGPAIRFAPSGSDGSAVATTSSGAALWVSSFESSTLTRISSRDVAAPATAATVTSAQHTSTARALPRGATVVAHIAVPPGGGPFTAGEGAVWSMDNDGETLLRIDPRRNAVAARIELPGAEDAAAGKGAVWLTHPIMSTVSRVDPGTNKVAATIDVGLQPAGIAVSPDAVWVVNAGDPSVSRIDPSTNRVIATIRVGPERSCCAEHMSVVATPGGVWVAVTNANELVRIDPVTNAVTATLELPYCPGGFLAGDEDALWSAGGGCADLVGRLDPEALSLTAKVVEPHPVGLALAFDTVWVAVLGAANVDQIDSHSGRLLARLPVGGIPVRLAVGFGAVWVRDEEGRILRLEPAR